MTTRLRQVRIQKGLSVRELARRSGVDMSYISKLERMPAEMNPTMDVLEVLAEELGVWLTDYVERYWQDREEARAQHGPQE